MATKDKSALGERLGSGKEAEVFACGALAIKLYRTTASKRSAFREAAILAFVESLGLPAPQVEGVRRIGDRWGVAMTRVEGPSFGDAMRRQPRLTPAFLTGMALLQSRVHSHPAAPFACLKAKLAANILQAKALGESRRRALLDGLAARPDSNFLCHGDFHPFNILGPLGREALVDWLDACRGDPAADVCRSYVLMRPSAPELASRYVDVYAEASGASRDRIFGWLPFVAAARLAEGVPDEVGALLDMAAI